MLTSVDRTSPYLCYFKFGQQQVVNYPMTLASTSLKMVVRDESRLTVASVHMALTFSHTNQSYSVLWDGSLTGDFLRGTSLKKYPVWGLYELQNLTVNYPRDHLFRDVLPRSHRDDIAITYAQAYVPFVKPLDARTPHERQPFLLSHILGKEFVARSPQFRGIHEATTTMAEEAALKEAIQ